MKKLMGLSLILIIATSASVSTALDLKPDAENSRSILRDETPKQERLAGTLKENGEWLILDRAILFSKGSKSERSVSRVRLYMAPALTASVQKLKSLHVNVSGLLSCEMQYSPWGAACQMSVNEIEVIE